MPKKKSKMGRPPLPPEKRRDIQRAVRMNSELFEELERVSNELRLSVPDLMRVGAAYIVRDIENKNIDIDRLYRDAAST